MINRSKRLLIGGLIIFIAAIVFALTTRATDESRNPWNKVWQAISDLQAKVDSLSASFTDLQIQVQSVDETMQSLNQKIEVLETRVNGLEKGGFLGTPAYDSGWVKIEPQQTVALTHDLNTTEVIVYMIGRNSATGYKIHQTFYGGAQTPNGIDTIRGAYWYYLDEMTLRIHRLRNDIFWDEVRILIWKLQKPLT
jgi:outer membrane murein-binding lipoprotein Lpp